MKNKINIIYPDNIYHIYNRAVEKRTIFYTDQDYEYFIKKFLFYRDVIKIKLLCYSVMPNHYHFLLKEPAPGVGNPRGLYKPNVNQFKGSNISKFMGLLANSYTNYFNLKYDHSGRIFQGPFKFKIVDNDDYLKKIVYYINLNPLKHKIVKDIKDWPYTSYFEYFGKKKTTLLDKEFLTDINEDEKDLKYFISELNNIEYEF